MQLHKQFDKNKPQNIFKEVKLTAHPKQADGSGVYSSMFVPHASRWETEVPRKKVQPIDIILDSFYRQQYFLQCLFDSVYTVRFLACSKPRIYVVRFASTLFL